MINEDSCTSAVHELWKCQRTYNQLYEEYKKLLAFVKSISDHFCVNEDENDFIKFYAKKEHEAHELLEELNKQ